MPRHNTLRSVGAGNIKLRKGDSMARYRKQSKAGWYLFILMLFVFLSTYQQQQRDIRGHAGHIYNLEAEIERQQSIINVQNETIKSLHKQEEMLEQYKQEIDSLKELLDTLRVETFEATAYTHVAVPGVADINGTGDGITRSGLPVAEGLIAVDPTVIPLGSHVWVEGFGVLLAADTGGAIKGNRIDIFMENRADAINWGRRKVTVIRGI